MSTTGRPPGQPKTGGRQKGTKNKVTDAMRRDILGTYRKLGGSKWLLEWAKENQTEFVKQCLSRVMPSPPRESSDPTPPPVVVEELSDLEAARRIALVLAKAAHAIDEQSIAAERVEAEPVEAFDSVRIPSQPLNEIPPPVEPPAQSLATYRGSSAEQRLSAVSAEIARKKHRDL